jgi:DNA sulfur modification protein DndC
MNDTNTDKSNIPINNDSYLSLSIEKLDKAYKEIQHLYLSDNRPWVIGYSGGKDSSATVQLVWNALQKLDIDKRFKIVHVITTDTLVENPIIVNYTRSVLSLIEEEAKKEKMPFETHVLYPKIEDSFWVNLIGKGYPAPQQKFRWCTDKLKIKPSNKFIIEQVNKYGEVIVILGIRENESMTRNQVMSLHKIGDNNVLYKHSTLPGAYIYAPIRDWSVEDVWSFLLNYNSTKYPWTYINKELSLIYKKAADPLSMECPLVIDNTTPSCGNSRFGCWVCTVVKQDKSMQSLIDHGEEWMKPLHYIRNFLSATQEIQNKPLVREYKRRDGSVMFKNNSNNIVYGPYKLEFCKEVLRMVLKAQEELKRYDNINIKGIELIKEEELHIIRRIWRVERGDWEDSLPKIYKEVTGREFNYIDDDIFIGKYESQILNYIANKYGLPSELLRKIIDVELQTYNTSKRKQIYNLLDNILSEEWRTLDEIKKDHKDKQIIDG